MNAIDASAELAESGPYAIEHSQGHLGVPQCCIECAIGTATTAVNSLACGDGGRPEPSRQRNDVIVA